MTVSRITLCLFLGMLLILSCGEKKKEKKGFSYERAPQVKEKNDDSNVANLIITGDDFMKFNKSELKVKAGQKVKLTLKHIGKINKLIMGHNLVILKEGTNLSDFAEEALIYKDNDYIPVNTNQVIAFTKMIGGGEMDVIEFDAPEIGEYDFICSFPGHYALMKGKFIVE